MTPVSFLAMRTRASLSLGTVKERVSHEESGVGAAARFPPKPRRRTCNGKSWILSVEYRRNLPCGEKPLSHDIADLIATLPTDPWRKQVPFSPELAEASKLLFEARTVQDRERALSDWLQSHQPCLFGRVAASLGLMHYCILTPDELNGEDEGIFNRIREERLSWHKAGWNGQKSGFVILALSENIALGRPGEETRRLAQRLCSLYLLTEIEPDTIYWDDLRLQFPVADQTSQQWRVGVNYFCAQGDGRWWHDHRIPGGMAFSMNSVGHLVKSRALAEGMLQLEEKVGLSAGDWVKSHLGSLDDALIYAMRTIAKAATAVSGKATELLPLPHDVSTLPRCPVEPLPRDLAGKNYCKYAGYYHTDITLPSEYFAPDVQRPATAGRRELDFTYLFDGTISNLDYFTMGAGVPIREVDGSEPSPFNDKSLKVLRSVGRKLSSAEVDRLIAAMYGG
jgi:hypothetical protein